MYSQYSVECIVIRLHAARTRFISRQWQDILFSKVSRLAVELSFLVGGYGGGGLLFPW